MQNAKDLREARRRRILERGSDRLSYIAGGSKHPLKPVPSTEEESSAILNQDGSEIVFHQTQTAESEVIEYNEVNLPDALVPDNTGISSQLLTDRVDKSRKHQFVSVKSLTESINRSQGIRAFMAMMIAFITVTQSLLSSSGNPWGDVLSVWSFGSPLGLLLLTNLSMVIIVLILRQTLHYKPDSSSVNGSSEETNGIIDKVAAINALEQFESYLNFGLLLKQAADAVSLDFSIYAVVLVCGLRLGDLFNLRR